MKRYGFPITAKACLLLCVFVVGLLNILVGYRLIPQSSYSRLTTTITPLSCSADSALRIYHIGIADIEGGVGTALYQLVVNQLWYAEAHNLTPWVHLLPNISKVIDDPSFSVDEPLQLNVHSIGQPDAIRQGPHRRHIVPGPPVVKPTPTTTLTIPGDGIWQHYFHPVSDAFHPSCATNITYVTTPLDQIHLVIPGLHGFAGIRCWRYDYLPTYITRPHQSWTRWIASSRQRAAPLVARYLRPRAHLTERAAALVQPGATLGLHIRHSDKAAGRRVVGVDEFLPFAEAFVHAGGLAIYVATDSTVVLDTIQEQWPTKVVERITTASGMVRSSDTTAVFDATNSHDRTNQEAIVEILALSRCRLLVHGHSAVSEAAIWTNPDLQYGAVNLEDENHWNASLFGTIVRLEKEGVHPMEWPQQIHEEEMWIDDTLSSNIPPHHPTHTACDGQRAILWIRAVPNDVATMQAFFRSVVAQIHYAVQNNWKPWVHLTEGQLVLEDDTAQSAMLAPGIELTAEMLTSLEGDGLWNRYFEPVSDFVPGDRSCVKTPVFSLTSNQVKSLDYVQTLRNYSQQVRFRPYLHERADRVLSSTKSSCLGVHIRVAGQNEKRKITAARYFLHMEAYVRAGGDCIYVATDTNKVLRYMQKNFPRSVTSLIRTQGDNIVRSDGGEHPTHMLDSHHRVNAETLVDTLALSRCSFVLHTNSTLSQVVLELNDSIVGVNIGDYENRMSPQQFEAWSRYVLGIDDKLKQVPNEEHEVQPSLLEPRIIRSAENRACRSKAIVYLAQKVHSSYGRDSFGNLLRSLELLDRNYLSTNMSHVEAVDIFIFHTGDFNSTDLATLEGHIPRGRGAILLVDLSETKYWSRPTHQLGDRPEDWYAWPLFSEGYRRMMHWFAIDIWDFFSTYNNNSGCSYRYILRLDEDSYIHSPIRYDMFDYMLHNGYVYGFRMCAYEMQVTQRMSKLWMKKNQNFTPQRLLDLEMCGFYNNFFIADLQFFTSKSVQSFLHFIDRQGHIYRRRLGDLMIHSMAVYWFAKQESIHRFLDFSYEHGTYEEETGCLAWGGIQAGYNDEEATAAHLLEATMTAKGCVVNATYLTRSDLSPSYAHTANNLSLRTVTAGRVELEGKGPLSG